MSRLPHNIRNALTERFGLAINRTGNFYPWQVWPMLAGSRTAKVHDKARA